MCERIHILGASGSGTTTLGAAVSSRLGIPHFDADDYYWLRTIPPYQEARPIAERVASLEFDLSAATKWILSGSCCGWGDFVVPSLDLVIFMFIPPDIRLDRLRKREIKRYGKRALEPGGAMAKQHAEFMDWASKYDHADKRMRSRALHEEWLSSLPCEVLRIEESMTTGSQVGTVVDRLSS